MNTNITIIDDENIKIFQSVFTIFIDKISSFDYPDGRKKIVDYRIVFNDCHKIHVLKRLLCRIEPKEKPAIEEDQERTNQIPLINALKKIFSSSIVVFWLAKLNKHQDEFLTLMENTFSLVKCNHFLPDSRCNKNKYYCYITKQSLNYLPNLTININSGIKTLTALREFILPIVKVYNNIYILVQNYNGIYSMFGGMCLNSGGLIIDPENIKEGMGQQRWGKKFVLDYLSGELGLLFSNRTKNTCRLTLQYQKNVSFPVLNKKIVTNYNCYTVELGLNHLTYLGFNANDYSFFKADNDIITSNDKIALIQISSKTGRLCLKKTTCDNFVSKNIHAVTKKLL